VSRWTAVGRDVSRWIAAETPGRACRPADRRPDGTARGNQPRSMIRAATTAARSRHHDGRRGCLNKRGASRAGARDTGFSLEMRVIRAGGSGAAARLFDKRGCERAGFGQGWNASMSARSLPASGAAGEVEPVPQTP
jgi:hypothetical protein